MRTALRVAWRVVLFFLAFALVGAAFLVPMGSVLSGWEEASPIRARLYADGAGAVAIALATWIMTRFVDRRPFRTIGFEARRAPRDLILGLGVGTIWLATSVGVAWGAGWASPDLPVAISTELLAPAAIAVALNVVTQQLLLCGYVFQTIETRSSFGTALVVSAALFTGYHAGAFEGGWLPPANVFGAAVVFCLGYGITRTLWFPIAIHFAWNALLGPVLGLTVSGTGALGLGWRAFELSGPDLWTGGSFGLEGGLVVTLSTALLAAAMAGFRERHGRSRSWNV